MKGALLEKRFIRAQQKVQALEQMIEDASRNLYLSREQYWEQSEFLGSVLESLTHPFYVIDAGNYKVRMANSAAQPYGLPQDITCYEMMHGQKQPCSGKGYPCPLEEVRRTGKPVKVEHIHFDGKHRGRVCEVHGYPIYSGDGSVVQMIEYQLDITRRKTTEEKNKNQLKRLSSLRDIDIAINASFDLHIVLGIILEKLKGILNVDATDLLLYRPHLQILEYAAGRGFKTDALKYTKLKIGESHAGQAALDRRTVHVADLREQSGFTRSEHLAAEDFISYFGVPVVAKGCVKGVLEIFSRAAMEPDSEWLGFLKALAGQSAIAIDNANMLESLERSQAELVMAYDETIEGWSRALDLRDRETEGHSCRVTELTLRTARAKGVTETEQAHMRRGALLHDIGKMGIPDSIFFKPEKLDENERNIIEMHPVFGYELLSPIGFLQPAIDIPYCHHEKWDGSGYPRGLNGKQIPLAARIYAVVDIFDALCSDRPYRRAWPREQALEHLRSIAGSELDPEAVEAFLDVERELRRKQE